MTWWKLAEDSALEKPVEDPKLKGTWEPCEEFVEAAYDEKSYPVILSQ